MSRIFDALQRSQGDDPQPRPSTPAQPVAPEMLAPIAEQEAVEAPAEHVAASVAATAVPGGVPVPGVSMSHGTGDWLDVPAERVLHPHPVPEQRLITLTNHNSQGAEMFRVLSTRLAHMKDKRQLSRLLVSSAVGDEGKSVVAVNLAVALSQRPGERVLLMEADLRRPTAGALLSPHKPTVGLTEWHQGKVKIEDSLYRVEDRPLWFLSAGAGLSEPLPILESLEFANVLETVSNHFDWVVLDSTPMLPMADAASLARLCDGVLVVVREGHTRRKMLNKALESIERKKLLGVVFNEAASQQMNYDRYYGEYGYYGSKKGNRATGDEDKGKAATA